jgi:hypothetical protein
LLYIIAENWNLMKELFRTVDVYIYSLHFILIVIDLVSNYTKLEKTNMERRE